jgi:hypothetical protein
MTAKAMSTPIKVLPRLVSLYVNELTSVMACANAKEGTRVTIVAMIFFIVMLINNIY